MQQLEYLKCFYNEKVPELCKEFGDAFRFWLASKLTAVEVDVRADRRLGGILPDREKYAVARNSKFKITIYIFYGYN